MKKVIHGKVWYWVDTVYDTDFIYDIYEDDYGNQIKKIVSAR